MSERARLAIAWSSAAILPVGFLLWTLFDSRRSGIAVIPLLVSVLLSVRIGEAVMRVLPVKEDIDESPPLKIVAKKLPD